METLYRRFVSRVRVRVLEDRKEHMREANGLNSSKAFDLRLCV